MKYIYINDSQGNKNLWKIIDESDGVYTVQRYWTVDYIHSKLCEPVEGSSILRTNIILDFDNEEPFGDEDWYEQHERFMNCECFNCWMICYDDEDII